MNDEVVPLRHPKRGKSNEASATDDQWLRRQAVIVVGQLPEKRDQALAVLRLAETLVLSFLGAED